MLDLGSGGEPPEVVGIAGEDGAGQAVCAERHMPVDDVAGGRCRKQETHPPGVRVVERDDVHVRLPKQACGSGLSGRLPPRLRDAACGDGDRRPGSARLREEYREVAVGPFDRDQCSGVAWRAFCLTSRPGNVSSW